MSYLKNANTIRMAHLIRIELPKSEGFFAYLTDYGRDIDFEGHVYSSGAVKSVGSVKQTKQFNTFNVPIRLSGLDANNLALVLSEASMQGNHITIDRVFLGDDGTAQTLFNGEKYLAYFKGVISTKSISDDVAVRAVGSSTITWTCTSSLQDFKAVRGRMTDDESHRGLVVDDKGDKVPSASAFRPEYQQDKGFAHANKSTKILASYQSKEKAYKMVKHHAHGFGGLVGMKSYDMKEYWETVTRQVNLDFNLSAKFLPVIYGVQKAQGIPVFADTLLDNPNVVYVVYAFCEGEIDSFLDFYIDDQPIICVNNTTDPEKRVCLGTKKDQGDTIAVATPTGGTNRTAGSTHGAHYTFDSSKSITEFWTFHGQANQLAAPEMVQKAAAKAFKLQADSGQGAEYWDSSYQLLDTAYVVFKFNLNAEMTEIPPISAEIQGRKVAVYNSNGTSTTTSTSLNFAWQTLDYLTSKRFGPGIGLTDVDIPSFQEVAALLDTQDTSYKSYWAPYWRYLGWLNDSNSNRQIMQGSPFLDTSTTVFKNLSGLISQFDSSLNIIQGKYVLTVEANKTPAADITTGDLVGGKISLSDTTLTSSYNSVQASILDPAQGWKTNSITFFNSKYKAEDNGVESKANIVFPYITNYYTARSRAERVLKKSRFTRKINFTLSYEYLYLRTNDAITLSSDRYSWDKKLFLVEDLEWDNLGHIRVSAREFSPDMFITSKQNDNSSDQIPDIKVNILPPTDALYSPDTLDTIVGLNGTLSWLPSPTKEVSFYTVRWTGLVDPVTVPVPSNSDHNVRVSFPLMNLPSGSTQFVIKAANALGVYSKPLLLAVNLNSTKNLPAVSGFTATNASNTTANVFVGGDLNLIWNAIPSSVYPGVLTYNIQLLDKQDTLLRDTSVTSSTSYSYTRDFNKADYHAIHAALGVTRELTVRIKAIGQHGEESVQWTYL